MKNLTEKDTKEFILEACFSIGAVYMTHSHNINPSEYFGGKWELVDTTNDPTYFMRGKIVFRRIE